MKGLRLALLLPIVWLIGCTLPNSTSNSTGTTPIDATWQNWQIQAGTAITSPPTGLYFVGAVQAQGTQSAGVFATPGTTQPTPTTGNIILNFLGSYDSSTGAVALFPAPNGPYLYDIAFTEPSTNTVTPANIIGGCVYPLDYQGPECLAIASLSPAVGVAIAPLTGTYTGTLTDASNPNSSGTATLTLTQSTTPNSSGQFPLSGTIILPGELGTLPVAGTVTGEAISLNGPSASPGGPSVNLTGTTNPAGTEITVSIDYSGSGGSFPFTGNLTLQ